MSAAATLRTDGVVLRSTPFAEADLIVTLYTRERGKLSALARGARRSRKRFAGGLGLLVHSSYELRERPRADLWALESAEQLQSFADLATDVAAVAHASYGTELIRELSPAEQPDAALLDLLLELYAALGAPGPSASMLRAFELALLGGLGMAPVLDRCVGCGAGHAALDAGGAVFDPGRGGVTCARCAALARSASIRPLPAAARRLLLAAQTAPSLAAAHALAVADAAERDGAADAVPGEDADAAPTAPGEGAAEARDAMLATILAHVGKPLRSLEFIVKMSGARSPRP